MNRKILITGCDGFIGKNLCQYYEKKGGNVFGLDISSENGVLDKKKYFVANLAEEKIDDILKATNFDLIIHCAGSANVALSVANPSIDFERNVIVLKNILESVKSVNSGAKFIFLSSAAIYGNPVELPITESSDKLPISPYGLHKLLCENICNYYKRNEGLNIKIARIFSAYGEGLAKQIFWDMYQKISIGGKLELYGTGSESRDFIHIKDICNAINLLSMDESEEMIFNIGNGEENAIIEIAKKFISKMGINSTEITFNNMQKVGDPTNWKADISKLKKIGYIKMIDLDEGIGRYIEWIKAEKKMK